MTAAAQGVTSEAILVEAVRRELERRGARLRAVKMPSSMSPLLAEIFVQSMPTFALLKDRRARIIWVNSFFERALDVPLAQIIGATITDLDLTDGIQKETILENIHHVLREGGALMSKEGMNLKGLGKVTVRAQRFVFNNSMLGDISFVENDIKDDSYPAATEVLRHMQHTALDPSVEPLLIPFLDDAPISIAIKRPAGEDSEIVWGNKEYLKLIGKVSTNTFGRLTTEVLKLPHEHPILLREAEVLRTGRARMSREKLHKHDPRWSLRFPIYDPEGAISFVGVVSPDFRQNAAGAR
jgi:PAS domain-containing protein